MGSHLKDRGRSRDEASSARSGAVVGARAVEAGLWARGAERALYPMGQGGSSLRLSTTGGEPGKELSITKQMMQACW